MNAGPRTRRAHAVRLSVVGLLLLAACGGNSATPSTKSWAERICRDTLALVSAGNVASDAVIKAQKATSVADAASAAKGPLGAYQAAVKAFDATWSDPAVGGTPMEPVRNALGKQLNPVYGASDQIDSMAATWKSATSAAALAGPLSDLGTSVTGAASAAKSIKVAIIGYKSSKIKGVAPAFTSGPECKKVK